MTKLLPAFAAACILTGCGWVNVIPAVRASLDGASEDECRRHVQALTSIGPRSFDHPENVRKAVDYLKARLTAWGYDPVEEPFTVSEGIRILAILKDDAGQRVEEELGLFPRRTFHLSWLFKVSEERLKAEGKTVTGFALSDCVFDPPRLHVNIIAEKRGRREPDRILELGAHYDTVPTSSGADDNTSGVAGVLETARLLSTQDCARTVRFCLFAMEEDGLVGSARHVDVLKRSPGRTVEGMLNFEMIGFRSNAPGSQAFPPIPFPFSMLLSPPTTGDFITVIGDFSSGWLGNLYEECADAYVPSLKYYSANRIGGWFPDAARSDHSPYWAAGISGIMLADTAEFRNPNYHLPSDLPGTLDYGFLLDVTKAAAATMLHWAGPMMREDRGRPER